MAYCWLKSPKVWILTPLVLALLLAVACGSSATAPPQPIATTAPAATTAAPAATSAPRATAAAVATAQPTATTAPAAVVKGKRGGFIPLHNAGSVRNWNLYTCTSTGTCMAPTVLMYNGLLQYNGETREDFDIRGDLAKDWKFGDDGQSIVFNLVENARWHDGMPVTADDVVFSLDEMVRTDVPRGKIAQMSPYYKSSRAINPSTVEVQLKFPAPTIVSFLAAEYMKILPKHHVETGVDMNLEENILGSGPFKLVKYTTDVSIEYERNDDYFKEGLPYLDGMEFFMITDLSRLMAAYKAGQVLMPSSTQSNLNVREGLELEEALEGKFDVHYVGPNAWVGLWINTEAEPFTDRRVRNALQLVLHRQPFVETFGEGQIPIGGPFPPDQWFSLTEDELKQLPGIRETAAGEKDPRDIARAQELMAEAGYPDGFDTTMLAMNILSLPEAALIAADQLKRWLNINIEVQPESPRSAVGRYNDLDFKLGLHGGGILVMDPDAIIALNYAPNATRNVTNWTPPIIGELIEAQRVELDQDRRRELVLEMSDYLMNVDSNVVVTHWTLTALPVDKRIKNYNPPALGGMHLMKEHLWFDN